MRDLKGKRFAFFAYEDRNLNTYPPIVNFAQLLVRRGAVVDIYVPPKMRTKTVYKFINIIVAKKEGRIDYITQVVGRISSQENNYNCYIAFYLEGLLVAEELNRKDNVPVVYFSLELVYFNLYRKLIAKLLSPKSIAYNLLYFLSNISNKLNIGRIKKYHTSLSKIYDNYINQGRLLKRVIRLSLVGKKIVRFGIAQDKKRTEALSREFTFIKKTFTLPNSYLQFNSNKSNFAYKKFGIEKDKKIVLYMGGLEKGSDDSMIDIINRIPDDYVLLLNVYSRDGYIKYISKRYRKLISQKKVIINTSLLEEEELDELVRSSYLGLVWYSKPKVSNQNMYYLGLSSGKLCKYLSCGIPVIAPDYFYGYKSLINNKLGLTCESASSIPRLLDKFGKNYEYFKKTIKKYYKKNLNIENKSKVIIDEIANLLSLEQ